MSKLRLFFLIILIPLIFFECEQNYPVPEVYVNFIIELNDPMFIDLNSVGNSIIIPNEGYKGIIITRTIEGFSAYDATCTYDPSHSWGRVKPVDGGIYAIDTVCGSKFWLMYDGMADADGPASIPLKMYVADYNPNLNRLHIHN
jgi:hypothetical protein